MTERIGSDLEGPISPPRDNGEIVFAAPWERRVFGLTVAACRAGTISWESFRQQLIRHICDDEARPYWQSWAAAFEVALEQTSFVSLGEIDERHRELLARPAGFDHRHA